MANLTARFQMIDDMSSKLDAVGRSGEDMVDRLEEIGNCAEYAFNNVQNGSIKAAQSVDGVASAASSAAQQGIQMGSDISEAVQKAASETKEFGDTTEEAGEKGMDAVEGIAQAFASVGIVEIIKEAAEAVYEFADSFSDAEKTITASTGATGAELDELMVSAERVFSSSHAESLDQVAAAMSSVRTATGLAGDELERATQYGLALEDTLGYEVSQSARTASSLMKNFGLSAHEAYNLITIGAQSGADKNGDLLDVLNEYSAHYAALGLSAEEFMSSLIDGAEAGVFSVDKVGDAVKEFNIRAKDGSETSAQAFEMLGYDAEEMAAKFASGGDMASEAFFTVVTALNNMHDPMAKNTAAVALFGTMYEDLEANILPVLGNIEDSTINMHDALDTVANDAKSLDDRWTEAGNSLSVAFSSEISPAICGVSETFAELVHDAGDYLQQHPDVTKAITAVGVGIGVAAAAMAGCVAITKVAIPLIHSFGLALNGALGPIGWISIGLTAATAALATFAAMSENAEDETMNLTEASRKQYFQLQYLKAEHEEACEIYGEESEQACYLAWQVEELGDAYEYNRQTLSEYVEENNAAYNSMMETLNANREAVEEIDQNEGTMLALAHRLQDLSSQTDIAVAAQEEMKAIIAELNESVPDLALSYDDVISGTADYVSAIETMVKAEAAAQRYEANQQGMVDALNEQYEARTKLEDALIQQAAAEERLTKAQEKVSTMAKAADPHDYTGRSQGSVMNTQAYTELQAVRDSYNTLTAEVERWQGALETATDSYEDHLSGLVDYVEYIETAGDVPISWQSAAQTAFDSVQTEMEELIQAYQDVYNEALTSFEGQFGLFEEASTESDEYLNATVENAQKAMDSQLAYWDSYGANLETLQGITAEQLNITQEQYDALMSYVQDGSAEAAGLAQSMVDNINSGNEEAVTELATTVADVATKQQEIASNTADWVTDFSSKMDELTAKMDETIVDLKLDTEADAAAKATIQAYADSILASKASAVSAADQVSAAVEAALAATNARINVSVSSGTPGHADGTTYSENVFIAGEEGPELIVGHEGSTVFPTTETDRIVNAVNGMDGITSVTFAENLVTALARYSAYRDNSYSGTILAAPERVQETASERGTTQAQDKTIRLEIAGSGTVNVGADTSKEKVVELLYSNLKPVLMSIVQEEIFEEGDNSYDF